jgi:hypothetical protein
MNLYKQWLVDRGQAGSPPRPRTTRVVSTISHYAPPLCTESSYRY